MLVFASGTKDGGGSGLRWLIGAMWTGLLRAHIVGIVSNHPDGGVRKIATDAGIDFRHLTSNQPSASEYRRIRDEFSPDLIVFSGWLKFVVDIDGLNIHPGILPETGGRYGLAVHQYALDLYREGLISYTAVTMHFVLESEREIVDKNTYDTGPIVFQMPVAIRPEDTAADLAHRVNEVEHSYQAWVASLVANDVIWWSREEGKVIVPVGYRFLTLPKPPRLAA